MNTADVERVKHAILEKAKERGIWLEDKYTNREQVATELARAAIAAMQTWQPIETAPRDGTAVLVYANRPHWEEAGYSIVTAYNDGRTWSVYGCAQGQPKPGVGGVQRLDGCMPTHWMALPAPPEDTP